MIFVTPDIQLRDDVVQIYATKGTGPGGQHVNTTNSAVQLRYDMAACSALTPAIKSRLRKIAGQRLTTGDVIVLQSGSERSQHRNKTIATDRLVAMIKQAIKPPKYRVKTRPTKGSVKRRLNSKAKASDLKKSRGRVRHDE